MNIHTFPHTNVCMYTLCMYENINEWMDGLAGSLALGWLLRSFAVGEIKLGEFVQCRTELPIFLFIIAHKLRVPETLVKFH